MAKAKKADALPEVIEASDFSSLLNKQFKPKSDRAKEAVANSVQTLAEKHGYGLVREYAGHGIGTRMHEDPQVPNYVDMSSRYAELTLRPGMVICVEPMLNIGTADVDVLDDGWTVVTADRKMSAHFEHTIAVTEDGAEILTQAG